MPAALQWRLRRVAYIEFRMKNSYTQLLSAVATLALFVLTTGCQRTENNQIQEPALQIQPWTDNPRYWAWGGEEPLLLLGASNNDNLFQSPDFPRQLETLAKAGGNFIRCTMSSRDSLDRWPYAMNAEGKYELGEFDSLYWDNFARLISEAAKRQIVVQVEIWDRFDFSRGPWENNPFNPVNNINYTTTLVGLDSLYPNHPSSDEQPFFHSIPGMPRFGPKLNVVRRYQEEFVDKLLSITLPHNNVLYCINNETSSPPEWGHYWADYVHERAKAAGRKVYVTDMFDEFYRPNQCPDCLAAFGDTIHYDFMDVSQINSRHFGSDHWDTLQNVLALAEQYSPRPVNNTKVYGGNQSGWGSGTNADGIARFSRDVLGGIAAVRHHRPPYGNGLNNRALNSIRSVRAVERKVPFWNLTVAPGLLSEQGTGEAYAAIGPAAVVVYFPGSATASLVLPDSIGGDLLLTTVSANGTFQSESLRPPYSRTLGISSGSEDGGWLLVEFNANRTEAIPKDGEKIGEK